MADETGEKKLHVDADWKAQARAEKEKLAREAETRSAPRAADAGAAASEAEIDQESLPPASFASLVQTLATQAMLFLTPQRDPKTGRTMMNVELAKHSIDLLSVLEEKTRGNLTDEEKRLLDSALYQTRMAYVRTAGL